MVRFALCGQTVYGTDDGFNPDNPGNPGEPVLKHKIELVASPQSGGSFNFTSQKAAEGSDVYLYAYTNSYYVFKGWMLGDSLLSTARSFYYNMPKHDVTITGLFELDIDFVNPGDPGEPKVKHTLTVAALPNKGGSFNFNETRLAEGDSIDLYAYTNTGFEFKGWQVDGNIVSTNRSLYYTMGKEDANVTAVFKFNPTNPGNPNKNSWDSSTGHVIVDDFTAGNLSSAIYDVTAGNSSEVTMITVDGKMSGWDFSVANNYENCTLVDLSRTYGFTEIPSYAYDYNTSLTQIVIPSCVEKIGYDAFYQCSNLADISCYAVVPPTVGSYAFEGIAEGAILRVLSSSVSLYAEADGWKDFTILPLSEEVRALEVSLPADAVDGRYKNMTLELVNAASGQRQKYVISDRLVYTFNGLLLDSEFEVYVRNSSNDVLGSIKGVKIEDEDVKVAFESLLQPQNVTLAVVTPDGQDVTAQAQVTWLKADKSYLKQGAQLAGALPETQVSYRINLPQTLGMEYVLPKDSAYTVQTADNNIVYVLEPIASMTVSGKVKDLTTNALLQNAVISVSQKLNGLYNKSYIAKTDNKGEYSISVLKDETSVTVSASDYVSKTVALASLSDTVVVEDIALKPITGAVVTTNFTFTNSVKEGETAEVQNWYEDYANVAYSIYNVTQNKQISEFNVQYPTIVLLEEVAENDRLRITATSKTNAFVPVEAEGVIDASNRASVTLDIVDLGAISAKFTSTDNKQVVGILYNAGGQLVKKYTYSNATLNISDLADGNYTLVSMANSSLFNSIYNLSQFASSGLVEGTDYVKNTVTVKSGVVASIDNELIPVLDESKLYYTGDNTSFSVNKTSVVAGNYITLKGKIDFKSLYAGKVGDVKMVVDLPESASFVDNSVMVGSSVASYTLDGSRLIIPLEKYSDQVRFCVIPTAGGEFAPNAFASFSLEDKEIMQPIGSANYAVKDLTISVPSTVAKTTIPVNGTAMGNSDIIIYDGDIQIGQTKSLANGVWSATCELNEPYNLSTHNIYAKVFTKQGLELQSETQSCMYDMNAIEVSKVTMINISHRVGNYYEEKTVFDFLNPAKSIPAYWYWPDYPEFTFLIDFTDNDTTKVSNVVLYVETCKGNMVKLNTTYDKKKNLWVASGNFGSWSDYDIPSNVSLDFDCASNSVIDSLEFNNSFNSIDVSREDLIQLETALDEISTKIENLSGEEYTPEKLSALLKESRILSGAGEALTTPDIGSLSEDEALLYLSNLTSDIEEILTNDSLKLFDETFTQSLNSVLSAVDGISTSTCENLTPELLRSLGYTEIQKTNSNCIYILATDSLYNMVDFENNSYISINLNVDTPIAQLVKSREGDNFITAMNDYCQRTKDYWNELRDMFNRVASLVEEVITEVAEKKAANVLKLSQIDYAIEWLEKQPYKDKPEWQKRMKEWKKLRNSLNKNIAQNGKIFDWLNKNFSPNGLRIGRIGGGIFALVDVGLVINEALDNYSRISNMYNSIPNPCKDDQADADELRSRVRNTGIAAGVYYTAQLASDAIQIASALGGVATIVPSGGTSLTLVAGSVGLAVANLVACKVYDRIFENRMNEHYSDALALKCLQDCGKPGNPNCPKPPFDDNDDDDGGDHKSNNPPVEGVHDPSGYVYEGVSSNRLEGVTATCYYKEYVEDMYGDKHENVVIWNAEDYAQENPLFTDKNGMYRWDVPEGLWQVKFEKEGYEPTESEWLPVPPPQLEVNVAMVQNRQPEVKSARAYEDAIEVEFDKYMQIESLNTDNVILTKNGEKVEGSVKLMNEEVAYEGDATTFASKIRFIPEETLLTTDEIALTVSSKVKSYAGVQMEADYTQNFDIEKEVKSLTVDSTTVVAYNKTRTVRVSAVPYDAAIGKKVVASSSSSMILSLAADTLTFDENGQAEVQVTGELPGAAAVTFNMPDGDVSAMTKVEVATNVLSIPEKPQASRASGTAVYRNTEIALTCETENVVIYYTTDGSCPCDENGTRKVYEKPIVIDTDNVTIKAMSADENGTESETAEFSYTLKTTTVALDLKEGWNWVSHNVETAVSVDKVKTNANRVVGQTAEMVNDPKYGLVGNLQSLSPEELYKVEVTANTANTIEGYAFNPAQPIEVKSGWNWIGYPVNQILSVTEAFANAAPAEGELISGQDGFTQYTNGAWTGTLETLKPGCGYMYYSKADKEVAYNAAIVSKANSIFYKGIGNVVPWAVNKYQYPNIMCLMADVYVNGVKAAADEYYVGAFCGTECRGIGKYVNGVLMMSIYGEGGEEISFVAMDKDNETLFTIDETEKFAVTILGGVKTPYALNIGGATTNIAGVDTGCKVWPTVASTQVYVSGKDESVDKVMVTDMGGSIVVTKRNVPNEGAVDISDLPEGVYVVTVVSGGNTFYQKIVKVADK